MDPVPPDHQVTAPDTAPDLSDGRAPLAPGDPSGTGAGAPHPPRAARTLGWLRRFAKLWGFALFCILVVYLFRDVALPFLFAILVAYILAPVVNRLSAIKIRGRGFPRALAVIVLYLNI